jgi:hypothetical protein
MVHVVQYLCPNRHTILAAAYEDDKGTRADAEEAIRRQFAALKLNPHCGICGAQELRFEDEATPYAKMADAAEWLFETMAKNIATRIMLDAAGATHDQKKIGLN